MLALTNQEKHNYIRTQKLFFEELAYFLEAEQIIVTGNFSTLLGQG